jgi:hypothetical protein
MRSTARTRIEYTLPNWEKCSDISTSRSLLWKGTSACIALAVALSVPTASKADQVSDMKAQLNAMRAASVAMEKRLNRLEQERTRQIAGLGAVPPRVGPPIPPPVNATPVKMAGTEPINANGIPLARDVNDLPPMIPGYMLIPGTNTSIKIGGYLKVDAIDDIHGGGMGTGTSSDARGIPLTGTPQSRRNGDFLPTARQTTISLGTFTPTPYGDMKTYVSMDFLGGTNGNQYETNSYSPRLKEAYASLDMSNKDQWLVGQTWSTFMDLTSFPETMDNGGPAGVVWIRQPMVRYTHDLGGGSKFTLAAESAYGDFEGNVGYGVITNGITPSTNIINPVPDFIAKYSYDAGWGHFQIAGLARYLKVDTGGVVVNNFAGKTDTWGGGGMVGLTVKTWGKDTIKGQFIGGYGVGRYLIGDADTKFSGASLGYCPGMTLACEIVPTEQYGGAVAYQHFWAPQWRSNIVGGYAWYPNEIPDNLVISTKNVTTVHTNLIYSPVPNVDLGLEFIYGKVVMARSPAPGVAASGEAERVQMTLKVGL